MASYVFTNKLDDIYATSGYSNRFVIGLPPSDAFNFDSVKIAIDSVCFNNLAYPINSSNNALTFSINNNPTEYTATLSEGVYTISTFTSALSNALALASGNANFTITFSTVTNKVTIANAVVNFKLIGGSMLQQVLGFESQTSFSNSSTALYPLNIAGSNWVDLTMNIYSNNTKSGRQLAQDIYARIPIDKGFGNLISWSDLDSSAIPIEHNFQELVIELFDENGNPFQLPSNASFSVVIRLEGDNTLE